MLSPEKKQEQINLIKKHAKVVQEITNHRAIQNDAKGIPEFESYNLIDLIEWTVDPDLQRHVAIYLIHKCDLQLEVKQVLRKYFSIFG